MNEPRDDSLLYDGRDRSGGTPGLHALLVGVGGYPNLLPAHRPAPNAGFPTFGLRQLPSAVTGTLRLARLLRKAGHRFRPPLKTCRALLSPVGNERGLARVQSGRPGRDVPTATIENLRKTITAWRADLADHPGNLALFYFSGHGIQREFERQKQLLALLHDFGAGHPVLRPAFVAEDLMAGMAPDPDTPKMAQRQIYCFDACREDPERLGEYADQRVTPLIDSRPAGPDSRDILCFYTTRPGYLSYGLPGRGTIFSEALIRCLKGGAGDVTEPVLFSSDDPSWGVTNQSLVNVVNHFAELVGSRIKASQDIETRQTLTNSVLLRLEGPPRVRIQMGVSPDCAKHITTLFVETAECSRILEVKLNAKNPQSYRLRAGDYTFGANVAPPTPPFKDARRRNLRVRTPFPLYIAVVD